MCFSRIVALLVVVIPISAGAASWSEEPAAYLSGASGTNAVIGRSQGPCLSAAEAEARAVDDAARQLVAVGTGGEREDLIRQMRGVLAGGRYVRDRSVTVAHRPYGDIWSAAVLVEAPREEVAAECARWARQPVVERARRVGAIVGVLAVVAVAYAMANGMTRGYFRGRLRVGAVVLACLATPLAIAWVTLR